MFDPYFSYREPPAFPPLLRAVSYVLSLAILGIIAFQTAATAAAIVA